MEGWTGNVSFTQLPEKVRGWTSRISEGIVAQAGALRQECFWLRRWMVRTATMVEAEWGWEWSLPHFHSPAYDLFLHLCFFLLRASPSFWRLSDFFPPPAFPHLPEPPCSLQFCQFLCALSPSVFVSFYVPSFSFSFSALVHILSTTLLKHLSSTFNSYLPKQFFLFISLLCLEIFTDGKYKLGFLKKKKKERKVFALGLALCRWGK